MMDPFLSGYKTELCVVIKLGLLSIYKKSGSLYSFVINGNPVKTGTRPLEFAHWGRCVVRVRQEMDFLLSLGNIQGW